MRILGSHNGKFEYHEWVWLGDTDRTQRRHDLVLRCNERECKALLLMPIEFVNRAANAFFPAKPYARAKK